MPMTAQDQILNFLRASGPILPAKVAKNIKESILIASAHLADLVSQGKVKISNLKVGGSPLYYLPGQESQIYQYAAGNMNPKDLNVLNKLKEKHVLKEDGLDTLSKVALRSLKDFAIPLHVTVNDKRELFWKWSLLSDEETNNAIRNILSGGVIPKAIEEPQKVPEVIEPETIKETQNKKEPVVEETAEVISPTKEQEETPVEEKSVAAEVKEEHLEAKEDPELVVEEPKKTKKPVKETPKEEEIIEEPELEEEDELAELLLEENKKRAEQKQKEISKQTQLKQKKPFFKKVAEKFAGKKRAKVSETFLPSVEQFFKKLEINIDEKEVIRKNSEIEFHVKISSVVGETTYFCKAKKKKRCDEKDLSAAYMQAQIKKLPLLFLYSHELSQKATEMLESDAFKNALIKKIELE